MHIKDNAKQRINAKGEFVPGLQFMGERDTCHAGTEGGKIGQGRDLGEVAWG